jgi:hypothetical protein
VAASLRNVLEGKRVRLLGNVVVDIARLLSKTARELRADTTIIGLGMRLHLCDTNVMLHIYVQTAVIVYGHTSRPVKISDHYFGRVGKGDAAVVTAVLLDANGQQASIAGLLPLFDAGIQSAH